jgi:hypothetical protein
MGFSLRCSTFCEVKHGIGDFALDHMTVSCPFVTCHLSDKQIKYHIIYGSLVLITHLAVKLRSAISSYLFNFVYTSTQNKKRIVYGLNTAYLMVSHLQYIVSFKYLTSLTI